MDSIKILSQACTHFYTGLHSPPYVILRRQGRLHEHPRPARDRSHLLHPRKYLCLTTMNFLAGPTIKPIQTIKTKLGRSEESRQGGAVCLHSKI